MKKTFSDMKRKTMLISAMCLVFSIAGLSQTRLTLDQAIEMGIKNNMDVIQAGALSEKSLALYKQSKMKMLPTLNGEVNQGSNFGKSIDPFTNTFIDQKVNYGNFGVTSSLLLFNGLSLQNEIKSNRAGYEASQMEVQQSKDYLTINIMLAYLQLLSAKDLLSQAQEQVVVTKAQVDRLAILNQEGAISPEAFYDLKGQLATEQLGITDSKLTLENARLSLTQLLNIPYQKDLDVAPMPDEPISVQHMTSADDIYKTALGQFAEVKAAGLRTISAEKYLKSVKGKLYPSLFLGAGVNTNYSSAATVSEFSNSTIVASTDYVDINGTQYQVYKNQDHYTSRKLNFGKQFNNNLFYTINLGLSIPLFNGSYVRSQIKMANIDLHYAKQKEQNVHTQLQQAIERAYINMVSSSEKFQLLIEQEASFSESFRIAEVKFNSGVITSVDYLVAKNNLDRTKSNLILSKYDFMFRKMILNFYAGKTK